MTFVHRGKYRDTYQAVRHRLNFSLTLVNFTQTYNYICRMLQNFFKNEFFV